MTDLTKLRNATSIQSMGHETINQMNRYDKAVYQACADYQKGAKSFEQAVTYIRHWG